jgi:thiol-disulfide isomerase/thioredoxin
VRSGLPLLALLTISCITPAQELRSAPAPAANGLPSVELSHLDGRPVALAAALDGRPTLISLWATWCDACAEELDALSRLAARASSMGAQVLTVAVGEPRKTVAAFLARRTLVAVQLVDEQFRLSDALAQKRVPTTLVVDRAGRIVFTGGALDEGALAAFSKVVGAREASVGRSAQP